MMMATVPLYRSPKRKRDTSEPAASSPPGSPTSTVSIASLQEARLREEDDLGRYSPRTAVAGRLKDLAIRESFLHSEIDPQDPSNLWQDTSKTPEEVTSALGEGAGANCLQQGYQSMNGQDDRSLTGQHQGSDPELFSPSTTKQPNSGARKKIKPIPTSKARSRRVSPPPPQDDDSLTWSDSEITGHNATDPNDDGYGINGIGFRPTAATAWARSQKRQKQVAEWKNREAREAREKRRERREGSTREGVREDADGMVQKRVKFDLADNKPTP